jgi:1,4-dihydroxy-2-naphthoyl-CoA hydrolase
MFETTLHIKLYDTDAAGIVFFANHFRLVHDAYEAFMKSIGCGLDHILIETDYILPVVHAEADYKRPIPVGAVIGVSMTAAVRETSFVLSYKMKDEDGDLMATLETVHVAVDRNSGEKIPLPAKIKEGLLTIRRDCP